MKLTDEQRAELADAIAHHPIGAGYYSTSIGIDEARDITDELAPLIEGWLAPAETPICSGQTWTNHLDKSVRIVGQVDTAAGAQPLGALWVADAVDSLFGQRWLVTDAWLAECGYELAEESA